MKTEVLILVPDSESFCTSKKSFVEFLKADALVTIVGTKVTFRRTPKSKDLVTVGFRVEMDKVKSKQERYILLALECLENEMIDEFYELCEHLKIVCKRLSPGCTTINTIWDDVGRIYAERSYPLINEVENLMRRLIAKFMLINVGMNWSKDSIHPDLIKKIESFGEDDDLSITDLHKLDFIQLNEVLFEKKRDISLEELDRVLAKTDFNDEDREKIKKYQPKSNWEKYFSGVIDEKDKSFEKKWELLYSLRNKVAHNRHVKKAEFEKIKGLSSDIKDIISKATAKLGEIDLNVEDRELMLLSYGRETSAALGFYAEKSVAEYYKQRGYEVILEPAIARSRYDAFATKGDERIAIDVVAGPIGRITDRLRLNVMRRLAIHPSYAKNSGVTSLNIVCVITEKPGGLGLHRLAQIASRIEAMNESAPKILIGEISESNVFKPFDLPLQGAESEFS